MTIDCPECDGAGEHIVNNTINQDPQCDRPGSCHTCQGTGEVEGARVCESCRGTGHAWHPGPTGEAVSDGPCRECGATGVLPRSNQEERKPMPDPTTPEADPTPSDPSGPTNPQVCPTCGSDDPAVCLKLNKGDTGTPNPHPHGMRAFDTGCCSDPFHFHKPTPEDGTDSEAAQRPTNPTPTSTEDAG